MKLHQTARWCLAPCFALILAACGGSPFSVGADVPDHQAPDASDGGTSPEADPGRDGGGDAAADGGPDAHPEAGAEGAAACEGHCAASAPAGWDGPIEVAAGSTAASCSSSWSGASEVLTNGLTAPDAQCSCSCGTPTGTDCSVTVTPGDQSCSAIGAPVNASSGSCVTTTEYTSLLSTPQASGGSCAPSTAGTTVPPVTWATTIQSCHPTTAPAGTCDASSTCAPAPDPGFSLCIRQAGDVACPAGAYGNKLVGYEAVDDTRACTACSCGAATGVSCGGSWVTYEGPPNEFSCSNSTGSHALQGCEPGGYGVYSATTSGGSCAASSTQPMGTATAASPVTFCCAL
jgi:hypothetical protein